MNYPATLNSFRSCLKVIDTFRATEAATAGAASFFSWIVPLGFSILCVVSLGIIAGGLLGLWNVEFTGLEFLQVGFFLWITALSYRYFRRLRSAG